MTISMKLVAKDILMAGCKQLPFMGTAVEVVDNIAKSHATLHMQDRLREIESSMTSFERRMRDLVKAEIGQTVQGLSQRDLSDNDFTNHIKNLYDIRQHGWSPALFQGLLERSVDWKKLCQNPAHYGSVLSDRQELDPTKLQVFIDADKTRILELPPVVLRGLLARQHDDTAQTDIVTSADVWAFVDGVTVKQGSKPKLLSTKSDTPRVGEHGGKIGDTIEVPLPSSLRMEFAWVPPGQSWLGGAGKPGTKEFTLAKGLWCGVYPVTQAEWQAVMGNNPSRFAGKPRHPVEQVSWDDTQAFLQKLNTRVAYRGLTCRLPSEQEWEYICRGGPISQAQSAYDFYFARSKSDLTAVPTDHLSSRQANFDGRHPAGSAAKGPYLRATCKVGLYSPNPLGIYDLHGNVWEWTSSLDGSDLVFRGGGWGDEGEDCTAWWRQSEEQGDCDCDRGFRVLAVPSGAK